jgi:predicted transcriptional regulator
LDDKEVKYVIKHIGANITDINTLITDLMRGDTVVDAVDRMVMDSVKKVTFLLEHIINEAAAEHDNDKRSKILEKYVRFWEMMKLFSQLNAVSRAHMVRSIFLEQPAELDHYEQTQIVCYWQKKTENALTTGDIRDRVKISSLVVMPGSPRLLVAFQLILQDTRMKEQQVKNEWTLRIKQLTDKKKRLVEDSSRLQGLKRDYSNEYWKLFELGDKIKTNIGEEEYEKLKKTTMANLDRVNAKMEKIAVLINDIDKFILDQ